MSLPSENHILNQDHQTPTWNRHHHTSLNVSLKSKIIHEDPQSQHNICTRFLHTNSTDVRVERCVDSLRLERSEDIAELERLAGEALGRGVEDLESEEEEDRMEMEIETQGRGKGATEGEKMMYGPLVRTFNHISNFPFGSTSIDFDAVDNLATGSSHTLDTSNKAQSRKDGDAQPNAENDKNAEPDDKNVENHAECDSRNLPPRVFRVTRGMLKPDTPQQFGFCQANPDISAIDETKSNSKYWRDADIFIEVKPSAKQGPKSAIAKGTTIPSLISQSADSARIYLASRPFMLYSIGILVFGTNFCVGVFDRDGITFSPIYDMFGSDIDILVRVIYAISRLSIEDLDFDPSVEMLDSEMQEELGIRGSGDALTRNPCPSYLVTVSTTPGDHDRRTWCTIGPPVYFSTSTSLLGKGTTVFHAKEYNPRTNTLSGPQVILKTSWRHMHNLIPNASKSESDVYRHVYTELSRLRNTSEQPDSGIAQWVCGGDVVFPDTTLPISVDNIRHPERLRRRPRQTVDAPGHQNSEWIEPTSTLTMHRLVLRSVGKSLTEYSSEKELLEVFRDCLQGHKNLCDLGILHRDISIGNVFIGENGGGFLADLGCSAYVDGKVQAVDSVAVGAPGAGSGSGSGGASKASGDKSTRHTAPGAGRLPKMEEPRIHGTLQFTAAELLKTTGTRKAVGHSIRHDIESFIWVLSYAVLTSLLNRVQDALIHNPSVEAEKPALEEILSCAFGRKIPYEIAIERTRDSLALTFCESGMVDDTTELLMSVHLVRLFSDMADLVDDAYSRTSPVDLTHRGLLGVVGKALVGIDGEGREGC